MPRKLIITLRSDGNGESIRKEGVSAFGRIYDRGTSQSFIELAVMLIESEGCWVASPDDLQESTGSSAGGRKGRELLDCIWHGIVRSLGTVPGTF